MRYCQRCGGIGSVFDVSPYGQDIEIECPECLSVCVETQKAPIPDPDPQTEGKYIEQVEKLLGGSLDSYD